MNHIYKIAIYIALALGITVLQTAPVLADCPNKQHSCVSGEVINVGMCFKGNPLKGEVPSCKPCHDWKHKCQPFPKYNTKSWMGDVISGDVSLSKIIIPGSHDAGMFIHEKRDCTTFGAQCNTMTQNLSIKKQLEAGTRYFDFRVVYSPYTKEAGANYITGHWDPDVKLKGKSLGAQGCLGGSLSQIHHDISSFLDKNKDEIVILLYSHFYDWKNKKDLEKTREREFAELVKKELGAKLYTTSNDGTNEISTIPIANIRGKAGRVIATFKFNSENLFISPREGILPHEIGLSKKQFEVKNENFSKTEHGTCLLTDSIIPNGVLRVLKPKNTNIREVANEKNHLIYQALEADIRNIFVYDMVNVKHNKQIIYHNSKKQRQDN